MVIEPDTLRDIFRAAATAPSGDNSQPWCVSVRGSSALVSVSPERADFFLDAGGFATGLGLGAFIEAAQLAAAGRGLGLKLTLVADAPIPGASTNDARPLCRLEVVGQDRSPEPELVAALPNRVCNRARYAKQPLTDGEHARLLQDTSRPPARVWLSSTPAELDRVARLVGEAEKLRAGIRQAHEDLQRWLRWTPEEAERTRDGLDVRTLALKPHEALGLRALRSWSVMSIAAKLGARSMQGAYMRELMQKSSAVVAIVAPRHETGALVAAGAAMLRVWLRATTLGLAVSPSVALPLLAAASESPQTPIEPDARQRLVALRKELDTLCGARDGETVCALLRVGHAPPPVRSLRRPLEDWFSIEEEVEASRD